MLERDFSFPNDIKIAFKSTRNLSNWNVVFSFAWLEIQCVARNVRITRLRAVGFRYHLAMHSTDLWQFPEGDLLEIWYFPLHKPSGDRATRFKLENHNERSVEQTTQSHKLQCINGRKECVFVIRNESSAWKSQLKIHQFSAQCWWSIHQDCFFSTLFVNKV